MKNHTGSGVHRTHTHKKRQQQHHMAVVLRFVAHNQINKFTLMLNVTLISGVQLRDLRDSNGIFCNVSHDAMFIIHYRAGSRSERERRGHVEPPRVRPDNWPINNVSLFVRSCNRCI